jgi:hypothetical protein
MPLDNATSDHGVRRIHGRMRVKAALGTADRQAEHRVPAHTGDASTSASVSTAQRIKDHELAGSASFNTAHGQSARR